MPKKSRKQKKEQEPNDEFIKLSAAELTTQLYLMKEKCNDLKVKRNYIQIDRDMVQQYFNNTESEIFNLKTEISNKETQAQNLQRNHNIQVKLYLQRVKHLEFQQQRSNLQIQNDGENAKNKQNQQFDKRVDNQNNQKQRSKKDYMIKQKRYIQDVSLLEGHHKSKQELLKDNYIRQLDQIQRKYQERLVQLKQQLDLKLKVEVHQVEERKNLHINQLMKNHEQAFRELKGYYNDITSDNLKLIRENKAQIKRLTEAATSNRKIISDMRIQNNSLQGPLADQIKKRDGLKYILRQFLKHKMSLGNYKSKHHVLKQKAIKLQKDSKQLNQKLSFIQQSKNGLEHRYQIIAQQIKHHANGCNKILNQRLFSMIDHLDEKQGQLQQVIEQSALDTRVLDQISNKVQQTVKDKNDFIRSLKYSIDHATKAYNDAIRVYEAKLVEFGVPAQQLGFQPLETITSTMPAGLVAS